MILSDVVYAVTTPLLCAVEFITGDKDDVYRRYHILSSRRFTIKAKTFPRYVPPEIASDFRNAYLNLADYHMDMCDKYTK